LRFLETKQGLSFFAALSAAEAGKTPPIKWACMSSQDAASSVAMLVWVVSATDCAWSSLWLVSSAATPPLIEAIVKGAGYGPPDPAAGDIGLWK